MIEYGGGLTTEGWMVLAGFAFGWWKFDRLRDRIADLEAKLGAAERRTSELIRAAGLEEWFTPTDDPHLDGIGTPEQQTAEIRRQAAARREDANGQ